ncbi:HDIG domain protein [Olavius sp. associated proteobacterium Delta 1]|nr:HDIG domain protein [Olavius sp. associated proteobacterium Delta 1]
MNPIDILARFYDRRSKAFEILVDHGQQVAHKGGRAAEKVAHLKPDLDLINNAAMLHDIGILHTDSPGFDCHGKYPYICHGFLGRELLDSIGLPEYGLISERHIGVGISSDDIRNFGLPLPERNMVPVSIEEQITCYADKFFSKNGNGQKQNREKSIEQILLSLQPYGQEKVEQFRTWVKMFE